MYRDYEDAYLEDWDWIGLLDGKEMTWIIGDIHGMYDALHMLVSGLNLAGASKFIFVGDYVDYGPSSKQVLDLVMELGDKAVPLMGNHEHLMLLSLFDEEHRERFGYRVWRENGADRTLQSFGCLTFREFEERIDKKYTDFLLNLACFHEVTIPHANGELKFIITHAGLMPDVPLADQLAVKNYHEFNEFYRKTHRVWIEDAFIWVREQFLNADPSAWDGHIVIHGHTPTHLLDYVVRDLPKGAAGVKPYVRRNENGFVVSVDIDTGAAFGKRLTALGLSPQNVIEEMIRPVLRAWTVQITLEDGYYRVYNVRQDTFDIEIPD